MKNMKTEAMTYYKLIFGGTLKKVTIELSKLSLNSNIFLAVLHCIQLCGFRGSGTSAAKSLFWQARKGQSFVLVFDSERDRNAAIVLSRRYALDCNVWPLFYLPSNFKKPV